MTSASPSLKTSWKRWKVILLVASVLAVFFATKDSLGQRAMGETITWGKNLWWKTMEWYAWALFSPLIFRICRKFDFTGRRWRMIAGQLGAAVVFSLLHCCVVTLAAWIEAQVIHSGFSFSRLFGIIFSSYFHGDVLTYVGIVSVWYALDYYHQLRARERQTAELEKHLTKARLQALKMQLHPHFLFNTLNGIASLNYEDPKAANRMLARLSELLRITLDGDAAQEAPLRKELEFIGRYLELEQIRLGDRLTVTQEIAPETLEARVPNLLLQPLVENALRHGIAPFSACGRVMIRAWREKETLRLQVRDSGPGLPDDAADAPPGLGLANTRARLKELYGARHEFRLENSEEGGLVVNISIPFQLEQNSHATAAEGIYENSHAYH